MAKDDVTVIRSVNQNRCMDSCISCARGFYFECGHTPPVSIPQVLTVTTEAKTSDEPKKLGRPFKEDNDITTSAGRKRAAELYPIQEDSDCEWLKKADCGGGKKPIVGCLNGKQRHRHHGPIKDTAHNERNNIHLICARCHNTWHGRNDPIYTEQEYKLLPHSPRSATPEDWTSWTAQGGKF